jgi:hypothetical protein
LILFACHPGSLTGEGEAATTVTKVVASLDGTGIEQPGVQKNKKGKVPENNSLVLRPTAIWEGHFQPRCGGGRNRWRLDMRAMKIEEVTHLCACINDPAPGRGLKPFLTPQTKITSLSFQGPGRSYRLLLKLFAFLQWLMWWSLEKGYVALSQLAV